MNRIVAAILFLSVLVCGIPIVSMAESFCDIPPQEVLDLRERYSDLYLLDYISFQLPDGSIESFCIDSYRRLYGYHCENSEWSCPTQVGPIDRSWSARFIRHDTATLRADGSCYPDDLGFDLVCSVTGNCISYHHDGNQFVICGWKNPSAYNGEVIMRGLTAMYYPAGSTFPEATCTLGEYSNSMIKDFIDLPFTPAHGKKLVSMTEAAVADYFPGYTLRSYYGKTASYSRIENGMLYVKRATFSVDRDQPSVTDCIPVPLSEELLQKLEKEPFDQLLWINGNSNLFQTEAAYDTRQIPVTGRIIHSDLQRDTLLLLMEDENGIWRLYIITATQNGYHVDTTPALPQGTYLDLGHAGDGQVIFKWMEKVEGDIQHRSASYIRCGDGRWTLVWGMNGLPDNFDYTAYYCGIRYDYCADSTNGIFIGTLAGSLLAETDLTSLPRNEEEMTASLDQTGWAKVNNPNPADRLHLRVKPDRDSTSLGKFYNGTPVQVIREEGDWCQVMIGTDGRLVGWMMKKYLAFGDQMDDVRCAFPQKVLRTEYRDHTLYTSMSMKELTVIEGKLWIAGVAEGNLYVILTSVGQTAYAPMDWFWEGNG